MRGSVVVGLLRAASEAGFEALVGVHGGSGEESRPLPLLVIIVAKLVFNAEVRAELLLALLPVKTRGDKG